MTAYPESWDRLRTVLRMVAVLAILAGLFYTPIAMSLGMMVLIAESLFPSSRSGAGRWDTTKNKIAAFLRNPAWSGPSLLILAVVLSGIWSESSKDWIWFARLKLPLLVIPLAFFLQNSWSRVQIIWLEKAFLWIAWFSTLPVLLHVLMHFPEVSENLKKGQPIPTPTHHIRYSMLIAFAGLLAGLRVIDIRAVAYRWVYIVLFLWVLGTLIILSTRSGIVVFFGGVLYLLWYLARSRGKIRWATASLAGLIAIMTLLISTVPTFRTKLSYMRYDWQQMKSGNDRFYSDSERIRSLKAGWEIWLSSPWTGTGMGDLRAVTRGYYKEKWGIDKHKLPHNQLLFVLSSTGLIGGVLFLVGFLWPLSRALLFKRPEIVLLFIVTILAGMVEHTLETAAGITLFSLFLSMYQKATQTS